MNMIIASAPVSTGKATSASTGSITGSESGSGFAGALIQAIDGTGSHATASNSLSLPVGLTGLLGQLGTEESNSEAQNLLELLTNLIDQLQLLEQSDTDTLSSESEEQLSAMLAVFQGLLQQLNQNHAAADQAPESLLFAPTAAQQSVLSSTILEAQPTGHSVVKQLREALQQLSTVIASSNKDSIQVAAHFTGQLKALLDSIPTQAVNTTLTAAVVADNESAAPTATAKSSSAADVLTSTGSKEAMQQTAASVQEPRRQIPALRDPVWRMSIANVNENSESNSQAAGTTPIATVEDSGSSHTQAAWTLLNDDPLANTESTAGKATLPAQVPAQQFAEQMSKFLIKQFQLTQGNGISEAKLTLTPEHLGQVDIRIVMQNGQLTAQFMTDNAMARDLLENQMSQLRSALNGQGLQVERLEVVQQPASSAGTSFMQQDQRHSGSSHGNGYNGRNNGDSYEDPAAFAAELERTSVLKEFGFGSSINVTA